MVRCGGGAGLNIEVCGAVRAPALDDGVVRCGCGPLHCGAVRSRANLLGPRRALVHNANVHSAICHASSPTPPEKTAILTPRWTQFETSLLPVGPMECLSPI